MRLPPPGLVGRFFGSDLTIIPFQFAEQFATELLKRNQDRRYAIFRHTFKKSVFPLITHEEAYKIMRAFKSVDQPRVWKLIKNRVFTTTSMYKTSEIAPLFALLEPSIGIEVFSRKMKLSPDRVHDLLLTSPSTLASYVKVGLKARLAEEPDAYKGVLAKIVGETVSGDGAIAFLQLLRSSKQRVSFGLELLKSNTVESTSRSVVIDYLKKEKRRSRNRYRSVEELIEGMESKDSAGQTAAALRVIVQYDVSVEDAIDIMSSITSYEGTDRFAKFFFDKHKSSMSVEEVVEFCLQLSQDAADNSIDQYVTLSLNNLSAEDILELSDATRTYEKSDKILVEFLQGRAAALSSEDASEIFAKISKVEGTNDAILLFLKTRNYFLSVQEFAEVVEHLNTYDETVDQCVAYINARGKNLSEDDVRELYDLVDTRERAEIVAQAYQAKTGRIVFPN